MVALLLALIIGLLVESSGTEAPTVRAWVCAAFIVSAIIGLTNVRASSASSSSPPSSLGNTSGQGETPAKSTLIGSRSSPRLPSSRSSSPVPHDPRTFPKRPRAPSLQRRARYVFRAGGTGGRDPVPCALLNPLIQIDRLRPGRHHLEPDLIHRRRVFGRPHKERLHAELRRTRWSCHRATRRRPWLRATMSV
jgi:hypothetical protein